MNIETTQVRALIRKHDSLAFPDQLFHSFLNARPRSPEVRVQNIVKAITNLHLLDVSVCGAVLVAGFAVACKAIPEINPFWGMLAMMLGAAMLFCLVGEELDLLHQPKQLTRAEILLSLPRNRRIR
ncbi:MAG: hypothetical protein ACYC44_01440 [Patescibacteria group bacterium]